MESKAIEMQFCFWIELLVELAVGFETGLARRQTWPFDASSAG